MNRSEAEAVCGRLVEEIALGIGGLYATGDLSERSADQVADLLEESWARSRDTIREGGAARFLSDGQVTTRRHPKIEALLDSLRAVPS